jgi:hypothetical protein
MGRILPFVERYRWGVFTCPSRLVSKCCIRLPRPRYPQDSNERFPSCFPHLFLLSRAFPSPHRAHSVRPPRQRQSPPIPPIADPSLPFAANAGQCIPPREAQPRAGGGVHVMHRNLHRKWSNFDHPLDPGDQPSRPSDDAPAHGHLAKRVRNNRTPTPQPVFIVTVWPRGRPHRPRRYSSSHASHRLDKSLLRTGSPGKWPETG